ncbi:MAG: hypothetical protein STSR0001_16910 [Methanothrix sp.]
MATKKTTACRQPKSTKKAKSAEPVRQDKKKDKTSQRKTVVIRRVLRPGGKSSQRMNDYEIFCFISSRTHPKFDA